MPPLQFETAELNGNEALKSFESNDDLAKAYVDLQGKVSSGSIDILPEEIRKDATIGNYKSLSDMAKGFIETKKLVGTIKHAPAKPEDYKFSAVEGLHPSVKVNTDMQKAFALEAHKMGMPNEYVDGVNKFFLGMMSNMATQQEKARTEALGKNETALRQEWGADYDKNLNAVTRMLTVAGGKDAEAFIAELGGNFKNAPLALKGLAKIASLLSEDSIKSLGGSSLDGNQGDEAEYNAYAEAIRTNDQKHPLMNDRDSKHNEAVIKWQKLQEAHFNKK